MFLLYYRSEKFSYVHKTAANNGNKVAHTFVKAK